MISDPRIDEYDRLLRGSPSHVASLDIIPNVGAKGLGFFPNSPHPEVSTYMPTENWQTNLSSFGV